MAAPLACLAVLRPWLSSARAARGSVCEKAAYVLGRRGGKLAGPPAPSEGGLFQRQVAKESLWLRVAAEQVRLAGLPSSDELRDRPRVPRGPGARAALGAQHTVFPPRHPPSLPCTGAARGGVEGCELGDVSPAGAFFFSFYFFLYVWLFFPILINPLP